MPPVSLFAACSCPKIGAVCVVSVMLGLLVDKPPAHGFGQDGPQSTPFSSPFLTPSMQLAAAQVDRTVQTFEAQSAALVHAAPGLSKQMPLTHSPLQLAGSQTPASATPQWPA